MRKIPKLKTRQNKYPVCILSTQSSVSLRNFVAKIDLKLRVGVLSTQQPVEDERVEAPGEVSFARLLFDAAPLESLLGRRQLLVRLGVQRVLGARAQLLLVLAQRLRLLVLELDVLLLRLVAQASVGDGADGRRCLQRLLVVHHRHVMLRLQRRT